MSKTKRLSVLLAMLLLVPSVTYATTKAQLHDGMRRLWSDHVAYTRLFILSAAAGAADKDATAQRLLQNQADIGNAVADFYGRDAGNKLTSLLKEHILIAADIVTAAKAGDNAKVTSDNKRWHDNALAIASFLHKANPRHWPEATLQKALFAHLDQTLSEASNALKGNAVASMKDYDEAMTHMLMVADILTNGIVAQFPSKFSSGAAKKK
jgi:hypothetical protein